jgi:RNA polymerase sigma factor (sigma-70 family)
MSSVLRHGQADRVFDRLYRKHVGDVYRYALAVTGNPADAEDVAQTTFLNAYRALETGNRPAKPQHWLIAIAHNVCRQRHRQASRRPTEVVFDEDVAEMLAPSDSAPTAADIQLALSRLPLSQRAALVMRELEGRSYAEIADVLELSVPAVETLLFRARRALREQLEGDLGCSQAEAAISLQLDGRLPRSDRAALRAHLRACEECSRLARSQRAQRGAWKTLAAVPLPVSLGSGSAGGVAVLGGAAAATKIAAVTAVAVVASGSAYVAVKHAAKPPHPVPAPAATTRAPVPRAAVHGPRVDAVPRAAPAKAAPKSEPVVDASPTVETPVAPAPEAAVSEVPAAPPRKVHVRAAPAVPHASCSSAPAHSHAKAADHSGAAAPCPAVKAGHGHSGHP